MSKDPIIITEFNIIPEMESMSGAAIPILPKVIPHTLTGENLKELYDFCESDTNVIWQLEGYAADLGSSVDADVDICEETCSEDDGTYYSWYSSVKIQQGDSRNQLWIREASSGNSDGFLNIGKRIHPPAAPLETVAPPMPTPTFIPKVSRASMGIESPPDFICANPSMVYDRESNKMIWSMPEGTWVLVYNNTGSAIDAYTAVAILDTVMESTARSLRKDNPISSTAPIYDVRSYIYETDIEYNRTIGIIDCKIQNKGVGFACIFGACCAAIPTNFSVGEVISPIEGTGKWGVNRLGNFKVLKRSTKSNPSNPEDAGQVFVGQPHKHIIPAYDGYFNVKDASRDGRYILRIRGGITDIGWVEDAELDITETCSQIIYGGMLDLDLVAQYINGGYILHFSADIYNDENITKQYFGNWLIASIYLTDEGKLGISQQWQNGAIYFGTRYWVK